MSIFLEFLYLKGTFRETNTRVKQSDFAAVTRRRGVVKKSASWALGILCRFAEICQHFLRH